jgi:hypothetical protein
MNMKLSKNTSLGLIGAGVVLVLVALLWHFLLTGRVSLIPNLFYVLLVLAIIVGGLGVWGYMGNREG